MIWGVLFGLGIIQGHGDRDFYGVLELKHDCSDREIETAFQKLSRKWHPDKNRGNPEAAEKYADINDAYATLRDAQKRRIYDLYGEAGVDIYEAPKNDFQDILKMGNEPGAHDAESKINRKGSRIRVQFSVDLLDFYTSKSYEISVARKVICRCPEAGFFCPKCRTKPTIRETVNLSFTVEKGMDDGHIFVFENAGDTSENNAGGDIEVQLVTRPHPTLSREGSDLHMNLNISLKEALLGFRKTAFGIEEQIVVESAGVISGPIRLPGLGLPVHMYPDQFGDIVVHPIVEWPQDLGKQERERLVEALM
jgi:DnaJ-class molecular chaperone